MLDYNELNHLLITCLIAAQSSALNVLTDVAVEYMLNLGKSLRAYCDEHDKTMTPEVGVEILAKGVYLCDLPTHYF